MSRFLSTLIHYMLPVKSNVIQAASIHVSSALNKYPCRKMVRDIKVRKMVQKHHFDRLNINAIRKTKFMPREIREVCDEEIAAFPLDACFTRIHGRCMITSRPRGIVFRWRLSRIAWRNVADYNKLSGVQRAMW